MYIFSCQDVLEEWLTCQRSWLYLEPIFTSEDITRQLPVESKRYQTMERIWRKIMKNADENREVRPDSVQICSYYFAWEFKTAHTSTWLGLYPQICFGYGRESGPGLGKARDGIFFSGFRLRIFPSLITIKPFEVQPRPPHSSIPHSLNLNPWQYHSVSSC